MAGFENKINAAIGDVKNQNEALKAQLLSEGRKSTLLAVSSFILSTVIAVGLWQMSKESDSQNAVTINQPQNLTIENRRTTIYNYYFNNEFPLDPNEGRLPLCPKRDSAKGLGPRRENPAPKATP